MTLVFVPEVEDDLIEVLQGERLEDLLLTLRIVGHVSAWNISYVTNFFIDSISSFFYSLDVFIQKYSYISQTHTPPSVSGYSKGWRCERYGWVGVWRYKKIHKSIG